MIGHNERNTVIAMYLPAQPANCKLRLEQRLSGERAKGQNDLRLHQLDLTHQVWRASGHFVRKRVPVSRRTVLQHLCDGDVLPLQVDGLAHLCEELSPLTHQWNTL